MRLRRFLESVSVLGIALAHGFASTPDLRLVQAVRSQDAASVRVLLEHHADVNAQQGDGTTALHWAVYHDDLAMADVLIRAGARADTPNDLGSTPLHLACNNRSVAMVDRLLAAKANPNAKLLNGETVLMTCSRGGRANSKSRARRTELYGHARRQHAAALCRALGRCRVRQIAAGGRCGPKRFPA